MADGTPILDALNGISPRLATDIDALEAESDQTVYDLFDVSDEEIEVIEDYLDVV